MSDDMPDVMLEPVSLDFEGEQVTGLAMGDDYLRRCIALEEARKVLTTGTSKLFASGSPPDVGSLIVLADWLLGVTDETPLDLMDGEGNVVARIQP